MARGNGRETFRKIITSPELIKKINPDNVKLMEKFLKNFATKRSPKSVVVYRSNLNIFMCYNVMFNDNMAFVDLKKRDLMEFFDYCVSELQWGSQRFHQMHSALSSFSTFIEIYYDDTYPLFRNLLPKIEKLPKEAVRKKSVFNKEELDKLMDWLGEINKPQEQCLLAIMMASGARASELVRFTTRMIDENHTAFDGLFLETTEEMQVKGRGTQGKHILRYIIKDLFLPYYKKWMPIREQIMKENGKEHDFIFIRSDGEPAQVSTIRSWIEKWDTVLEKHLYPHSIRHFWTTYLLSLGLEKEFVQELQDWSSDTLVNLYNDATMKDRKWKNLDKLAKALKEQDDSNN